MVPTFGFKSKPTATNSRPSSWLAPSTTGTRLDAPRSNDRMGCFGIKTPSTLGKNAANDAMLDSEVILLCSARMAAVGRLRRQETVAASLDSAHPKAPTMAAPEACAPASDG